MTDTRECRCCHKTLPLDEFPVRNKKTGSRYWQCRECLRTQHLQWERKRREREPDSNLVKARAPKPTSLKVVSCPREEFPRGATFGQEEMAFSLRYGYMPVGMVISSQTRGLFVVSGTLLAREELVRLE